MTKKRFIDGGEECIEDQFLIDTLTDKYYWIDNGLDDIVNMLNTLHEENQKLKKDIDIRRRICYFMKAPVAE